MAISTQRHQSEAIDNAIRFTRSLADVINNLCPGCKDIIREELACDKPASRARPDFAAPKSQTEMLKSNVQK